MYIMQTLPAQMEQAFAEQVKRAYSMSLLAFSRAKHPVEALLTNYSLRNTALDYFTSSMDKTAVGCAKGCASCCHQMVASSPFEVFWIAKLILDTWTAEEVQKLRQKLNQMSSKPKEALSRFGIPCPLLNGSLCSMYEFRPLACRTVFSKSKNQCDDALAENGGQIQYPADPIAAGQAMDLGLSCAVWGALKVDMRPVELCGALLQALNGFDLTLNDWLSGRSPLAEHVLKSESDERSIDFLERLATVLDSSN